MSMEVSGLRQLRDNLERLKDKAPEVMEEPNTSPHRRLTTPWEDMDMVIIGRSA